MEETKKVTFNDDRAQDSYDETQYDDHNVCNDQQPSARESKNKFQIDIEDLIQFIFPEILQHPLAAGRLFAFGMYGPLDENNELRTGPKGSHKTTVWELDAMCKQIEREDLISIYLDDKTPAGLLSGQEQDDIIAQADSHLKKAKGRAMLPQITKQDIYELFQVIIGMVSIL